MLQRLTSDDLEVAHTYTNLSRIVAQVQCMNREQVDSLRMLIAERSDPEEQAEHNAMIAFVDRVRDIADQWPNPTDFDDFGEYMKAHEKAVLACVEPKP